MLQALFCTNNHLTWLTSQITRYSNCKCLPGNQIRCTMDPNNSTLKLLFLVTQTEFQMIRFGAGVALFERGLRDVVVVVELAKCRFSRFQVRGVHDCMEVYRLWPWCPQVSMLNCTWLTKWPIHDSKSANLVMILRGLFVTKQISSECVFLSPSFGLILSIFI